ADPRHVLLDLRVDLGPLQLAELRRVRRGRVFLAGRGVAREGPRSDHEQGPADQGANGVVHGTPPLARRTMRARTRPAYTKAPESSPSASPPAPDRLSRGPLPARRAPLPRLFVP